MATTAKAPGKELNMHGTLVKRSSFSVWERVDLTTGKWADQLENLNLNQQQLEQAKAYRERVNSLRADSQTPADLMSCF